MSDISLSKAVRSNLLSLQKTADLMAKTQERLATGNKVNSALDNPTNFFTASSLNARAGDLNALMDSMANGVQTLQAADNGLKAITKTLESMQSTLRQARQDKSFQTASFTAPTGTAAGTEEISFSGGAFGASTAISLTKSVTTGGTTTPATGGTFTLDSSDFVASTFGTGDTITLDIDIGGGAETLTITGAMVGAAGNADATIDDVDELAEVINAAIAANGNVNASAAVVGGNLVITNDDSTGTSSTIAITNIAANDTSGDGTVTAAGLGDGVAAAGSDAGTTGGTTTTAWKTVDELVAEINNGTSTKGLIRASNDNGKLRIENLSTQELDIDGINTSGAITGTTGTTSIDGNSVRASLADQFNELRDQLDKLSDDASFNGINLLRGDLLRITFNETGTSSIDIQTKDEQALNSAKLNLFTITAVQLDSDSGIDAFLGTVKEALNHVRSQASTFGQNLSIVENRRDFTKNMINTLQTGAANLTLADMNEEAANLLALQTRQSLSSSSLSLASQADQSVLQLLQ